MLTNRPQHPVINSTYVTENSHQFNPQSNDDKNPPSFHRRRKKSISEEEEEDESESEEPESMESSKQPSKLPSKQPSVQQPPQLVPPQQVQPQPQLPKKPQMKMQTFQFDRVGINMGVDYSWRPFIPNIQPIPEPIIIDRPAYIQPVNDPAPRTQPPDNLSTAQTPKPKDEPLAKKSDEYNRAACTLYKAVQCVRFFDERSKAAKIALKHQFYRDYYDSDANGFLDQSIEMVKTRIGLILDEVIEDEELDLSTNEEKLEVNAGFICDEIADICSAKKASDFDNPLVLSFMANMCTPGAYLPHGEFTAWVISRLSFTSTNQLSDSNESTGQLILGEYLIGRVLCANILFNPEGYKPGQELSDSQKKNLQVLGSCFAQVLNKLVNGLELEKAERGKSSNGIPIQPRESIFTMGELDSGFSKQADIGQESEYVDVEDDEYKCFDDLLPDGDFKGAYMASIHEKLGDALSSLYTIVIEQQVSEKGDLLKLRKEGKDILIKVGGSGLDKKYVE